MTVRSLSMWQLSTSKGGEVLCVMDAMLLAAIF
jgi:hypothetical protein